MRTTRHIISATHVEEDKKVLSRLVDFLGVKAPRHLNDEIIRRIEELCTFVPHQEFCYTLTDTEATRRALELLQIKFFGPLVVFGFSRNPVFFEIKDPEYCEDPPTVLHCQTERLEEVLKSVGKRFGGGSAWLVSDESFSVCFYIHTDGIVGKFTAADLIKLHRTDY